MHIGKSKTYSNLGQIYFVSFADTSLLPSLQRIKRQAEEFNCFRKICIYTEKNLPRQARKRAKEIISVTGTRRGYGYWSWKPAIVKSVMKKMKDGDVLLYSDAGTHLNARGKDKLFEYIERARLHDIWVIQLDNVLNDLNYTKRDTAELFKADLPNGNVLKDGQIQATFFILVKSAYTTSLIKKWDELMELKNVHYFDDSPSVLVNDSSFVENRHDQSLFSLLLKSNHYYAETECRCYAETEEGWNQLALTEPILARRDKQRALPRVSLLKKSKRLIKKVYRKFVKGEALS